MTLAQIRERFGAEGITGMAEGAWPRGAITDDTQMTLFRRLSSIESIEQYTAYYYLTAQAGTWCKVEWTTAASPQGGCWLPNLQTQGDLTVHRHRQVQRWEMK